MIGEFHQAQQLYWGLYLSQQIAYLNVQLMAICNYSLLALKEFKKSINLEA